MKIVLERNGLNTNFFIGKPSLNYKSCYFNDKPSLTLTGCIKGQAMKSFKAQLEEASYASKCLRQNRNPAFPR
jgi:hypothetical protein